VSLPDILNEKMLFLLDRELRRVVLDETIDPDDAQLQLVGMCVPPWEIASLFGLPTSDPTSVIDRYRLRAIATADYRVMDAPFDADGIENQPWATDVSAVFSIPLFSPLDVWRAARARANGYMGIVPPPIKCESDRLICLIGRGYESITSEVTRLADKCHDLSVLAEALSSIETKCRVSDLEQIADSRGIWRTAVHLQGRRALSYLRGYASTALAWAREWVFDSPAGAREFTARWVSGSFIDVIESVEGYHEAVRTTKWLFYKHVAVNKGRLPEEQHNRMVVEAMCEDRYAKAYLDDLSKGGDTDET